MTEDQRHVFLSRVYSLKILFRSELGKSLTGGNLATVVYWIELESLSYTDSDPKSFFSEPMLTVLDPDLM